MIFSAYRPHVQQAVEDREPSPGPSPMPTCLPATPCPEDRWSWAVGTGCHLYMQPGYSWHHHCPSLSWSTSLVGSPQGKRGLLTCTDDAAGSHPLGSMVSDHLDLHHLPVTPLAVFLFLLGKRPCFCGRTSAPTAPSPWTVLPPSVTGGLASRGLLRGAMPNYPT